MGLIVEFTGPRRPAPPTEPEPGMPRPGFVRRALRLFRVLRKNPALYERWVEFGEALDRGEDPQSDLSRSCTYGPR